MDALTRTQDHRVDTISLCNGTDAVVRPISPDDGPALVEFHRQLSDRVSSFRHLSPPAVFRADEVEYLICVDGLNRAALVVEVNGAIIAVGRYDRLCDPKQAEVALVVGGTFQHQYIASELLHRLAHLARTAGVSQFAAEVLFEDATTLSVFREAGFAVTSRRRSDVVEISMDIA